MKAVQADLRGQKSLCRAPYDQAETTVSCLAEIGVTVSSIDERAGPEHHGYHDTRKVRRRCWNIWVVARVFPSHVLIKLTRPQCPIDVTVPVCRTTHRVCVKAKRHRMFDADRCIVS